MGVYYHPHLSNFTIEDANKDRVYFDSSQDIIGDLITGFNISGKTIISLVVNMGQSTGHYFIVSIPFTWWDNVLIEYTTGGDIEGSGGTMLPMALTRVTNNIVQPTASNTKYASVAGSGGHNGTSESDAWTLAEALANAVAGDKVWIKAGEYGSSQYSISNNGAVNDPIEFIGYTTTIDDIADLVDTFTYVDSTNAYSQVNSTVYPVLRDNGSGSASLNIANNYIILKHIQFGNNNISIKANNSSNIHLEDVTIGRALGSGFGIRAENSSGIDHIRMLKCVGFDAAVTNFWINGNYNAYLSCKVYSGMADGQNGSSDYHLHMEYSQFSMILDCLAERVEHFQSEHLIGIKGTSLKCLVENNDAIGADDEIFYFRGHISGIVLRGNRGDARSDAQNGGSGLCIRDGVEDSIFENNYITGCDRPIAISGDAENPSKTFIARNNIIRNNIFYNGWRSITSWVSGVSSTLPISDNKFYNNLFYVEDGTYSQYKTIWYNASNSTSAITGNEFKNNIFRNLQYLTTGTTSGLVLIIENNVFHDCTVTTPANNSALDPLFVSEVTPDFHLQETSPVKSIGVDLSDVLFDKDDVERVSGGYAIGPYEYPPVGTDPPILVKDTYGKATLAINASNYDSLRWYKDGVEIVGEAGLTYTTPELISGHNSIYYAIITNTVSSVQSSSMRVTMDVECEGIGYSMVI